MAIDNFKETKIDEELNQSKNPQQLVEGLEDLRQYMALLAGDTRNLGRVEAFIGFLKKRTFLIGFPLIVTTMGTIFAIASCMTEKYPLINYLLLVVCIILVIGIVHWFRHVRDFPAGSEKVIYEKIAKVSHLFDGLFNEIMGSAAVGLTTSNFLARAGSSRGDKDIQVVNAVRSSIKENVDKILDSYEKNPTYPIFSFESRLQSDILPVEELLTTIIQHAMIGIVKPPFLKEQKGDQEIRRIFSSDSVILCVPCPQNQGDINFQDLFKKAKKNCKKDNLINRLEETKIFFGSRIVIDNKKGELSRFVRFCFWPKHCLYWKAVRCYIEMQEINGIPTFWIDRNEKNIERFFKIWDPFFESLPDEDKELFPGIPEKKDGPSLNYWTDQYDFFVGPHDAYRGYEDHARNIASGRQDLVEKLRGLLVSVVKEFSQEIVLAKDIAWVEFAREKNLDDIASRKRWEEFNKHVRASGFCLCYDKT